MKEVQLMIYKRGTLPGTWGVENSDVIDYRTIRENEPEWPERFDIIRHFTECYCNDYDVVMQFTHDEDYPT